MKPTERSSSQPAQPPGPDSAERVDLSRMRHELRTPINHILGYCEMLMEEAQFPKAHVEDLRRIHTGGRELQVLIARYFDEEQFFQQRDLHQLYHELRTPVNQIIGYSDLLIEQADDPEMRGAIPDLQKIRDAAANWLALMEAYLIEPATSAAPEPEDASVKTPQAIALNLGFTFKVPEPKSARSAFRDEGAILVVDDDENSREMLARRLRRCGYTVSAVSSGLHALALARGQKFDLVMLDMIMPGLDGFQVLAKIKADPALRETTVIMLSALDEENGIARCIEMGAEDYLAKPFNPVFLRARIGACLEKKRLRDQETAFLHRLQAEQDRSERLLLNILPKPIAERLKQGEKLIADSLAEVTVLFSDFVNFTKLSDGITPSALVGYLNEVFSAFDELCERHGLEKIKTIGDAYLAVGGLPAPLPTHAQAAAELALAMQEEVARFAERQGVPLRMRVGLNSGPVVAGVIGKRKFAYDLWGDTVNVAYRMQVHAPVGGILATKATYEHLRQTYAFKPGRVLRVKGKGRVVTYRLLGRR